MSGNETAWTRPGHVNTEPCSDALSPVRQRVAAGDQRREHAGGGQARVTRPSSAQLRGAVGTGAGRTRNHFPSSGCRGDTVGPLQPGQLRGPSRVGTSPWVQAPCLSKPQFPHWQSREAPYLPSCHRHSTGHIPIFTAAQGWVERALEKGWMWFRVFAHVINNQVNDTPHHPYRIHT